VLTRRTFIKSTLVANMALVAPASLALSAIKNEHGAQPLLIFTDENSANANLFSQQFSESNVNESQAGINLDIGLHFDTFNTFCKEKPNGWISGITRDSDFFVLQQLATQHGYHTAYFATHTVSKNTLEHRVTSSAKKAPLLAQALNDAGARWPTWLADNLATLQTKTVANSTANSPIQSLSQADDNHVLASWLLIPSNSSKA
jgi:hypothetical protein